MPSPDPQAACWFATHVQPHEPALRAYLHGIAPPSDIDDVVQETYVRCCAPANAARLHRRGG